MGPRNLPQEQPQQLFNDAAQDAQSQKAQAELEATVLRFWDTVRKSADVIVTLRQENAILQAQVQSLRKGETELQTRVDDFLGRIADLEEQLSSQPVAAPFEAPSQELMQEPGQELYIAPPEPIQELLIVNLPDARDEEIAAHEETIALLMRAHEAEVTGLRINIDRLEDELGKLQREANRLQDDLNEAQAQLGDHAAITQQLALVRTELEARTKLLFELQTTLEEQRTVRQSGRDQLDMFSSVTQRGMTPPELVALAGRLDGLSVRISSLFGIS